MVKSYRQFRINPQDADWLRILFIFNGIIRDLRLITVAYGTAPVAFQALRSMLQMSLDYADKYPLIMYFLGIFVTWMISL